jgi:hypothetical protein
VLGNGPSLRGSVGRAERLRADGAWLLGSNRVYMPGGLVPDVLCVTDYLLERDCRAELAALAGRTRLVLDEAWRPTYPPDAAERVAWYVHDKSWYEDGAPAAPLFWRPWEPSVLHAGGTVTYALLQLALMMGFANVLLLGVDHRYTARADVEVEVPDILVSRGPDPDHFNPDYFGEGRHFHEPRIERMTVAYRVAERALSAFGVRVVNGTPGTALTVFPLEGA